MCGIAGIASLNSDVVPNERLLRSMCDVIRHRGPNSEGMRFDDTVGLAMRRLSIIDVVGGKQPYVNEDKTIWCVFNGEIYNFQEIRKRLEQQGHQFKTSADGEVIVHLWEEYGVDFPKHLNGMFAIALYDSKQKRLILVRDRLGIKPLFFSLDEKLLVFGSEIKCILATKKVPRELDVESLGQFLAWEYVPGTRTLFRAIKKLAPGEMLDFDLNKNKATMKTWWQLPSTNEVGNGMPRTENEWLEAVDAKIKQCVRRQLVSDVPLGAFLSGGVDSSLIVSAMDSPQTFSIGFDDATYNELPWARKVSQHLRTKHEDQVIRPSVVDMFDKLMNFMDDPIGDFSIFPTFLVSQLARRDVTVALSGDGGDELFGGYETYLAQQKARTWMKLPRLLRKGLLEPVIHGLKPTAKKKGLINKAKRFAEGMNHDPRIYHARWRQFVDDRVRDTLFTVDARSDMHLSTSDHILQLQSEARERDELDRCLYVDMKSYLCENCLVKVDRMSMACSLETRVPFLDHELVELAFRMPSRFKASRGQTKILLKKIAAKYVPPDCVYRKKEGFSIPIKDWLKTEFRPLVEELLSPEALAKEGLINASTVQRMRQEHDAGTANHSHVLWSLLVFQDWRRRWQV